MKIIPQLDTYPRLVSFGQTVLGKAMLAGAFALGLLINRVDLWIEAAIAAVVIAYVPARRRLLLSLAGLYWLLFHPTWLDWDFLRTVAVAEGHGADWSLTALVYGVLAAVLGALALFFRYVRSGRNSFAAKRPVLCMLTGYALVLTAAGLLPLHGTTRLLVWIAVVVTAPYLWYLAYALKDASTKTPDGVILQFGTLLSFWTSLGSYVRGAVKGAAYLRKIETRSPRDLSIVQLKAIKLLMWAFVIRGLQGAVDVLVYGDRTALSARFVSLTGVPNLGVPRLDAVLLAGAVVPLHIAWASVIANLTRAMLNVTVNGHVVIACCRMAGFYALRNTYRPLESRTLTEYWSRTIYYYKELLVEFFYYPAFTRYFKQYRRFRVFAATMAAVCAGNIIFNVLSYYYDDLFHFGLRRLLIEFHPYAFYYMLLGLGIGISQVRNQGKPRLGDDAPWWRRALATTGVLAFFAVTEVFDREGLSHGLGEYMRFALRLFLIPA